VIFCVKLAQTEPAKLESTFSTFHEFTALALDDHNFAGGAHLREEYFVEVAIGIVIVELIQNHVKISSKLETRLLSHLTGLAPLCAAV
jgi:hypothetical protein